MISNDMLSGNKCQVTSASRQQQARLLEAMHFPLHLLADVMKNPFSMLSRICCAHAALRVGLLQLLPSLLLLLRCSFKTCQVSSDEIPGT
jgi:hypothetical protein